VDFGVLMFVTEYSLSAVDFAREAEELGFDMVLLPEHTHIPVSRRSPWPGGTELPREYSHSFDPIVALAAAAAVTSRIKLGTGVTLVIEHDPIVLAKQVATIDQLSNGRFMLGVGGGWNREEMENHGTDPRQRFAILRERVLAMREIWTKDEAEYHGEHVNFDPIWSWPKPVQRPHPPVWVGGNGAKTLERIIEYGDGWMPIPARGGPPLAERISELGRMAEAAGRPPIPTITCLAPPSARVIEEHQQAGAVGAIFGVPATSPGDARRMMARCAEVMRSFR
jgi:probable F420-dependent oxidoreductase